jgi:hypothetical protein
VKIGQSGLGVRMQRKIGEPHNILGLVFVSENSTILGILWNLAEVRNTSSNQNRTFPSEAIWHGKNS